MPPVSRAAALVECRYTGKAARIEITIQVTPSNRPSRSIHDLEAIVFAARRLNKMLTQVVEGARIDGMRLVLNRRPIDLVPESPLLAGANSPL